MQKVSENPSKNRALSPLVIIVGVLITCYLTANVMAVKLIQVCGITIFDAGTIIFPITYMLGDVLTEIWGVKTARRVIWLTFGCMVFFTFFVWIAALLPYPPETQTTADAYRQVFNLVPRITIASLTAFLVGQLINAWTMFLIKKRTHGHRLWVRTIGSSVFGYIADTTLFVFIAFAGIVPFNDLASMVGIQIVAKLAIEALSATPLAYLLVAKLRRKLRQNPYNQ